MAVTIDPNTFYTIADICGMFDLSREAIEAAMKSPVCRLEAARIGQTVYVRGEHLLRYFQTLVPDDPTALSDETPLARPITAPLMAEEPESTATGVVRQGDDPEHEVYPKVLRGMNPTTGSLKKLPGSPVGADKDGDEPRGPRGRAPGTPPATPAAAPPRPSDSDRASKAASAADSDPGRKGAANYDIEKLVREAEQLEKEMEHKKRSGPGGGSTKGGDLDKWL